MAESKDHLQRRCPRLGGTVLFKYCRNCGEQGTCCFKILNCWWEIFDIEAFLRANMREEDFQRLVHARPKPKMVSLLELIEKAQAQAEGDQ